MRHLYRLSVLVLILLLFPSIATAQPQVPTPTGFLGGRESADATGTVVVVPTVSVTPPASPTAEDVPGAAECLVGRSGPDIETLTDPPSRGIASPEETRGQVPTRTLAELPPGEVADEATVREVTATIRRLLACSNSGDNPSFVALHTDDYFRRAATVRVTREESSGFWEWLFDPSESTTTSYGFAAFPLGTPMPELSQVTVLPDGRIGAVVSGPGFAPLFFAFTRERPDGPYLVDETIQIIDAPGTPAA